jgi:hypothetical protein
MGFGSSVDRVAQTDKRTGKCGYRQTEQVWHRSKAVAGCRSTGWRLEFEVFSSGLSNLPQEARFRRATVSLCGFESRPFPQ